MFDIVLYEPEIPPNTGNTIRLAANAGARLHIVKPMGFTLRDKQLQRAGLDYHELASLTLHADWRACCEFFAGRRMFAVTTRATQRYDAPAYREGDVFLFGPETRGLPGEVLAQFPPEQRIRLPMRVTNRSLNLSNAVAIVVYEAWRQLGFPGGI
ncbi:MAG: tRNA (uridine(34)/cytosine(34)/5-carboxymethylaminomethyluridine(34)-2'-O)-methyltransferase TrmL [Betaproteobacteria bacterium RIFCSPLOWO2_12_FULL_62_13]|nr:MAG: tRNA (uridine(34)/cytosine(34)/5-carboxymethylaminomethyluridine(34)-2'-O)-methyltransferase TrmL [Betaproteobacteria bacterium RIFCSPLOWO2_12_FULL_62_13]